MELVIDKLHCPQLEQLNLDMGMVEKVIQEIIQQLGLDSLKRIVVTGNEINDYKASIVQYVGHLSKHVNVTDNEAGQGFAVVIHALNNQNELEQIVFFREGLFCAFLISLFYSANLGEETLNGCPDTSIGMQYFMHEIGHALDYQKMYTNYDYLPPDKIFNLAQEYDAFIYHEGLTIWSEYYAERIASAFSRNDEKDISALADFIHEATYPKKLNEQVAHSFRVAYNFAHYAAKCHLENLNNEFLQKQLENAGLEAYSPILVSFYDLLADLMDCYENWDFPSDSKKLAAMFNRLIRFERKINSV